MHGLAAWTVGQWPLASDFKSQSDSTHVRGVFPWFHYIWKLLGPSNLPCNKNGRKTTPFNVWSSKVLNWLWSGDSKAVIAFTEEVNTKVSDYLKSTPAGCVQ